MFGRNASSFYSPSRIELGSTSSQIIITTILAICTTIIQQPVFALRAALNVSYRFYVQHWGQLWVPAVQAGSAECDSLIRAQLREPFFRVIQLIFAASIRMENLTVDYPV